jgi:predicted house-cleaning noncanonical NTP pyrophosphatase (MazG superfamily)
MTKYSTKKTTYNKLVRDLIPSIIGCNNQTYKSHIANEEEYTEELHKKLIEETNEFFQEPSVEEVADILEVLDAIKKLYGYSDKDIEKAKKKKFMERGGFEKRIILEDVYEIDL